MSLPSDISVSELNRMQQAQADFTLVDVRDDDELTLASLDGALHVPMDEVAGRLDEIPKDRDVVVMCHSGGRSARVAAYLRQNGFPSVANLAGGIDAWSREIDPSVPRYSTDPTALDPFAIRRAESRTSSQVWLRPS
jgi:rhodanese-related sulfurtransferase